MKTYTAYEVKNIIDKQMQQERENYARFCKLNDDKAVKERQHITSCVLSVLSDLSSKF